MSECAYCEEEMDMTRAVWWTPLGVCCTEQCARILNAPAYGALARAEALAAGDPDWMNVERWPRQ